MTKPKPHRGRVSKLTLGVANAALALAVILALVAFASGPAQAQFKTLHTFTGLKDGGRPQARVISDASGNLYGTTLSGGNLNCNGGNGCGVVWKLTPTRTETVLHRFAGAPADGASPYAALTMDASGNLFGTTRAGGGTGCFGNGCGTVFEIDTTGKYKVLYRFTNGTDGGAPSSALTIDATGRLVGTTSSGGDPGCVCGVVYAFDLTTGKEIVLMSFPGGPSGAFPGEDALAQDASGNFYGTTGGGGDATCNCGVVYKLEPTGTVVFTETVLSTFRGGTDGEFPSGVTLGADGNLYGTTILGGVNGKGTLYAISASEVYKKLYDFGSSPSDGQTPIGGVLSCSDSSLYWTTEGGGTLGFGTIGKRGPLGKVTVVHNFDYSFSGGAPLATLSWSLNGGFEVFSGTASQGGNVKGASGSGLAFQEFFPSGNRLCKAN
jgi:uncharacterized repeat protein (TIGR03803 family)